MSDGARPSGGGAAAASISGFQLRRATVDDVAGLKRMYAEAFYNDPIVEWMIPDERGRRRRLRRFFAIELRHVALPRGAVWMSTDFAGAAMTTAPGRWRVPLRALLLEGTTFGRWQHRAGLLAVAMHRRHPPQPSYVWLRLREAGGGEGFLPASYLAGIVGFIVLLLAGFAAFFALVHRAPEPSDPRLLYDLSFGLLAISGVPTALALASFAASVFRSGCLPRWIAWLAVVAALAHVVLLASLLIPSGFFSLEGGVTIAVPATLFAWILATGVALIAAPDVKEPDSDRCQAWARARDDLAVVENQDGHLGGSAQPSHLGAVRAAAAPGPRRCAVAADPLQLIVMPRGVERRRGFRAGMYDRRDGPENRNPPSGTRAEVLSPADVEDHARRLLP